MNRLKQTWTWVTDPNRSFVAFAVTVGISAITLFTVVQFVVGFLSQATWLKGVAAIGTILFILALYWERHKREQEHTDRIPEPTAPDTFHQKRRTAMRGSRGSVFDVEDLEIANQDDNIILDDQSQFRGKKIRIS